MPYGQELPKNSGKNCSPLSNTRHTGHMKNGSLRAWLLSLLGVCVLVAWAIVIAVALSVSEIVLKSLHMIVELAGMS